MIKTSNLRNMALLGAGAGALGLGGLAASGLRARGADGVNSRLDRAYRERPDTQRLFLQPIRLDAADPFTSVNNIRQRAADANNLGNEISERLPSTGFFNTILDRTADQVAKSNFALGQGYVAPDMNSFHRKPGVPLASF